MSTDHWIDELARDSARGISRRQVFGRLLGGTGLALLSMFGLRRLADKDCSKHCEECCHTRFPNGGREFGQCVSDCQHGEGFCGRIVCPEG